MHMGFSHFFTRVEKMEKWKNGKNGNDLAALPIFSWAPAAAR